MLSTGEVFDMLRSGSSGDYGIHAYMSYATCPAAGRFKLAQVEAKDRPLSFSMDVGAVFHELRRRYHNGLAIDIPRGSEDSDQLNEILEAGHEMFDFYRSYMPVGHIGKILHQEETILDSDFSKIEPGILSGKPDLILDVEEVPETLKPRFLTVSGLPVVAGRYLYDDKTHPGSADRSGSMPGDLFTLAGRSLQFIAYHYLARKKLGLELDGTIVHHLVRHRVTRQNPEGMTLADSVAFVVVDKPTEDDYLMLKEFIKYASFQRQAGGYNLAACEVGHIKCPFLGTCPRRTVWPR